MISHEEYTRRLAELYPNLEITGIQPATPDQYDESLAQLAASDVVSDDVLEAHRQENLALFHLGLPQADEDFDTVVRAYFSDKVEGYIEYSRQVQNGDIFPNLNSEPTPRVVRRQMGRGGSSAVAWFSTPDAQLEMEYKESRLASAIYNSPIIRLATLHYCMQYYPELTEPEDQDNGDWIVDGMDAAELESLFGPEITETNGRAAIVSEYVRQNNNNVTSREFTEQITRTFIGYIKFDIADRLAGTVMDIGKKRFTKQEPMAQFCRWNGDSVTTSAPLADQVDSLNKLAKIAETYSRMGKSPEEVRFYRLHGEELRTLSRQYTRLARSMVFIHDALKLDIPDELRPFVEVKPVEAAAGQVAIKATVDLAVVQLDEAEPVDESFLTDFLSQSQALKERAAAAQAPWRQSSNARKANGFNPMIRLLRDGFVNDAGVQMLSPLYVTVSHEIVDTLSHLQSLVAAGDIEGARSNLEAALAEADEINLSINELQELAKLGGISNTISVTAHPERIGIRRNINYIRQEWDAFRQIILKVWPGQNGFTVAKNLQELLFLPTEESPASEAHEDSPAIPAEPDGVFAEQKQDNLHEGMAKLLDKIILPPKPTERDIKDALARIGYKEGGESVQWQRISDLAVLAETFKGDVYVSKPRNFGRSHPYFVAPIEFDDNTYAIAESPVFGNATFVVAEKLSPGTWLEILELHRQDAVEVGARRIIHSNRSPHGPAHIAKIMNVVFELHLIERM